MPKNDENSLKRSKNVAFRKNGNRKKSMMKKVNKWSKENLEKEHTKVQKYELL